MKPVPNKRTTPLDVGDIIVHRYGCLYTHPLKFKIISLRICRDAYNPCSGCSTGNISYKARRFNKRLGIKDFNLCPIRNGVAEYVLWIPPILPTGVLTGVT